MERLTLTMKHAATYRQLRPLYDQYRQSRDKEKFLRGHESEIILFKTAARKLKRLGRDGRAHRQKDRPAIGIQESTTEEREYDTLNQNVRILLERSEDVVLPKESSNELE